MAGRQEQGSRDAFAKARDALVREVEALVGKFGAGDGSFTLDPKVLEALRKVPREKFVPDMEQPSAYANQPLPIGHRQTISQPLIVALMTHHLQVEPGNRILEIGTGSGYQTAVLAELADDIVTIENVPPLARAAKSTLEGLGYRCIQFIEGDGRKGAPDLAPFDRIIVTAAAETMPDALVAQLDLGGRLVAPIGERGGQELVLVTRSDTGDVQERSLFPVAFVPLTYGLDDSEGPF